MPALQGGCLCGDVRLEISADPVRVGICHCLDCRKNHGALFRTFAIFPGEAMVVSGATSAYDSGRGEHRHFCGRCGSPLFARFDDTTMVEVFVGVFDQPNAVPPPTYESWTIRREAWLPPFGIAANERDRPQ